MTEANADALWGEAAIYFSLDITEPIYKYLDIRANYSVLRDLNRKAIAWDRAERHDASLFRKPTGIALQIEEAFRTNRMEYGDYREFVENSFECAANSVAKKYAKAVKFFQKINFEAEARKQCCEILNDEALIHKLNAFFDEEKAKEMLDAAFYVDGMIDNEDFSDWDKNMLEKHASFLGRSNPLAPLVKSAINGLIYKAANKFSDFIGQEKFKKIQDRLEIV